MITEKSLRRLDLFASLEPQEREHLASKAADIKLKQGEWLAREGADAATHWLPKSLQRDQYGFIFTGRDVSDFSSWGESRNPFLLETNLPGLFCAGDVRHGSIKRVSSAVGEGSMAITSVHQFLASQCEVDPSPALRSRSLPGGHNKMSCVFDNTN